MKYCVPYSKNFKYKDKVDEFMVDCTNGRNIGIFKQLSSENSKFQEHQRFNLIFDIADFQEKNTIKSAIALKDSHPQVNFSIVFKDFSNGHKEIYEELKLNEIPYFFLTRVNSLDKFRGFLKLGVSDIYIVEELGFFLNSVGQLAHASGVSIRVFANICQSSWYQNPPLKSFFVRPEGVPIISPYVDVIEFFGDNNVQEVMYKVYALDKKWFGDLREIIIGLDIPLDSRSLDRSFDYKRMMCRKKCYIEDKCKICDRHSQLSKTFSENQIYLKYHN